MSRRHFESLEPRNMFAVGLPQLAVDGDTLQASGGPDDLVTVEVRWVERQASYDNEFGVLAVDDALGSLQGLSPTDSGYRDAALANAARDAVFASGEGVGATTTLQWRGGDRFSPYIVADASAEELQSLIASGEDLRQYDAFFAIIGANSDGFDHFRFETDVDGIVTVAAEDIYGGGDQDFTDVVATFEVIAIEEAPAANTIEIVSAPSGVTLDQETATLDLSQLGPGIHTIVVEVGGNTQPPETPTGEIIINETFDGGVLSTDWTEANSTDDRGQIVQLTDGQYAYEFEYRRDEESFKLQKYPFEFDSLYTRIEETYPDGLPIPGAMKQSRIFNPQGGEYLNLQIWGNGRQDTNFSPIDTAVYYDFPVSPGETIVTEYFFAWNDPGQSNGQYWIKRNGETLVAFDNLYFADEPVAAGVWVGGNVSGAGQDPHQPFRRQLRSVEIIANPTGSLVEFPVGDFDYSVVGDFKRVGN